MSSLAPAPSFARLRVLRHASFGLALLVSAVVGTTGFGGAAWADPADIRWSSEFGAPGVEGYAQAAVAWSGGMVVAGDLAYASGRQVNNIAWWNGTEFIAMGEGLNARVTSLAVVAGILYAAGDFTASGATPLPNVARWTGTAWVAVGSGAPDDSFGLRLAADGASLLLLGGFTQVGSPPVAAQAIARWNGSAWSDVGGHAGASRLTAAARVGSRLYVGGDYLESWDGATWEVHGGYEIQGLTEYAGDLYLCGDFLLEIEEGVEFADRIARWDGTTFDSLDNIAPDGGITRILVDSGQLLALGWFTSTPGPQLAYWDGASWSSGPYGIVIGTPYDAVRIGADLFCVGNISMLFDATDGGFVGVRNVAVHSPTRWHGAGPGSGVTDDSDVRGLRSWNNRLYAAGSFKQIGAIGHAQGIAMWDGVGWSRLGAGLDEAFGNPSGRHLTVWNNRLVVSGYFSGAGAGAVVSANIAAWNGTAWEGFAGGFSGQGAHVVDFGGTLIATSSIGTLGTPFGGGPALGHVARWTGTAWQTIGTATPIFSVSEWGTTVWNGKLIFAGSFTSMDGVPAQNIAAWNGTSWSALGDGFNNFVTSVAVHDGELYASGVFTASGVTPIPGRVARWTGTAWVPAGTGTGAAAMAMRSVAGRLYVTGGFSTAGGAPAERIAAWDGTQWSALGSGLGTGPLGNGHFGLAFEEFGGGLFVGGFFNTAGGYSAHHLARWDLDAVTAVGIPGEAPGRLLLSPPAENPVRAVARLSFRVERAGPVEAVVVDLRGRLLRRLATGHHEPGDYPLLWDGRDSAGRAVESGIYWVAFVSPDGRASQKLTWLR